MQEAQPAPIMFRIFNYPQPQPHLSTSPPTHHSPSPIPDFRVEIPSERTKNPPSPIPTQTNQLTKPRPPWYHLRRPPPPRRTPQLFNARVPSTARPQTPRLAHRRRNRRAPPSPAQGRRIIDCGVRADSRMRAVGALEEPETPSRVKDEIESEGGAGAGPMTSPPSGSRRYLTAFPVAAAGRGRGRGGIRRRGSRFTRQRPYNLRPRMATPTPSRSDMSYNSSLKRDSERRIKSERNDLLTSSPGTSRLDGSILPFPLGPETIDDLPFLRQAVTEMEMHLGTLRRRVRQLEDRERVKNNSINPWELV
ncbi:hypothetical protein AnigIFM63309_002629 [Aspergillus niger]|nr:hypothetical protein AnigIFM63309_002629 [Aspergillus niger]